MNKFATMVLLAAMLAGCKAPPEKVVLQPVAVEDIVGKPDPDLMKAREIPTEIRSGASDYEVTETISNNNLRARTSGRRLDLLQQYVCNLFKEPVGEVCEKGK